MNIFVDKDNFKIEYSPFKIISSENDKTSIWLCDKDQLQSNDDMNIKTIVCRSSLTILEYSSAFHHADICKIEMGEDYCASNLEAFTNHIDDIVICIHNQLHLGSIVMICDNNWQLMPSILAAYLIRFNDRTPKESISYIQNKCPKAFAGELNFLECLCMYYKK